MEVLGIVGLIIGGICLVVGGIWFIVEAFKESVLWGVLVLLVPFAPLVFLIMYFDRAWGPLALQIVGAVIFFGCMMLGFGSLQPQ